MLMILHTELRNYQSQQMSTSTYTMRQMHVSMLITLKNSRKYYKGIIAIIMPHFL